MSRSLFGSIAVGLALSVASCGGRSSLQPRPLDPVPPPPCDTEAQLDRARSALLAVMYWKDHSVPGNPAVSSMLLPPSEARVVLEQDVAQGCFGANTRLTYAREYLASRHPAAIAGLDDHPLFIHGMTKNCAPYLDECVVRQATREFPRSEVKFRFDIGMDLAKASVLFDPQSWDGLPGSMFSKVQRRIDAQCPALGSKPEPADSGDYEIAGDWHDTVFERFSIPRTTTIEEAKVWFEHMLCFDSKTISLPLKDIYRVYYSVCPGLEYPNKMWAGNPVESGMEADEGCSWIVDDKSGSLEVNDIKSLELSEELCEATDYCSQGQVDLMGSGLKLLAVETAIAFARANSREDDECRANTCEPPGENQPGTFVCNAGVLGSPSSCPSATKSATSSK